jgi:hypothetical protein
VPSTILKHLHNKKDNRDRGIETPGAFGVPSSLKDNKKEKREQKH